MSTSYIDLRSDTVTTPTPEMRKAISSAPVGDDGRLLPDGHYGDPTVRELEQRVADLLGKPAALLTSTGIQANMIALRVWCNREDTVAIGRTSHILRHEPGAFDPRHFGLRSNPIPDETGFPDLSSHDFTGDKLLCVENTHNAAGGIAWHPDRLNDLTNNPETALPPIHLDGARLFNASVALDLPPATLASVGDSIMVCLSKGLGAPLGSVLAGDTEWIGEARKIRKIIGGQMRQAGVIAAGGIHALNGFTERLQHDHDRARTLASALTQVPGLSVEPASTETNIVRATVVDGAATGARLLADAASNGVLLGGPKHGELRLVTHQNISDQDLVRTVAVIANSLDRDSARLPA